MKSVLGVRKSAGTAKPKIRARGFSADLDHGSKLDNLLSPSQQTELGAIATVLEFRTAGAPIYSEGEDAHFLYTIESGVIRISRHLEDGGRQVLAFMWPSDLFGLAERGHYVNSAETLTAAIVYRFPLQKLRRLLLREPQLQLHFLIKAAHELRAAQRQIIILGQRDTYRRLASFLLDSCQQATFFDAVSRILTLPMSRFDIADYLGTSPETVARAFARLEHEGLIKRLAPRSIKLRDMRRMSSLVQSTPRTPDTI
jgi:CRP-like cAMP-binding protein